MKTIGIFFFLLTAVVSRAQTRESAVSLADTQQRTLTSAKIGQRYEILVSLPESYVKSGQSYPVLYVLDGWHFHPVLKPPAVASTFPVKLYNPATDY